MSSNENKTTAPPPKDWRDFRASLIAQEKGSDLESEWACKF
jgi:hypothetical protein